MSENNFFKNTITNEETALLPAAMFQGKIEIVENDADVAEACKYLSTQSIIGFDTETRPSFKAGATNRVALLQLSSQERCYLFRLCRIKFDKEIIKILESKNIIKIGADVAGDMRSLHQLRRFREAGFIDLQSIAAQWGVEERSLRKLSAIVLGKRVSKAQRLSNWEALRLTDKQMAYAATDAWVCIKIYDKLIRTQKIKKKIYVPQDTTSQRQRGVSDASASMDILRSDRANRNR